MRVLVAGGAGFVGSHLTELLLANGDEVTVLDNFVTGSPENLAHLRGGRLKVTTGDVEDARDGEYDRVYHLASPASPEAYGRHQIATLRANSVGTRQLLDVALRANAKFLMASTSEVYGDPLVHPQPETYWGNVDPIGARSMYDEGKRFAEALVVAYVRERGADARIARLFNSYGPRMQLDDGRMPSAFIAAALRGEPLPVHDLGMQTRSLCYVGDTVAGLVAAMERGRVAEAYNIGRNDEITVLDFARAVLREAGSSSPIALVPGRPQDIARRCPDTRKSERELAWRPTTTLTAGLSTTIAWYRVALADAAASPPVAAAGER